MRALLQRVRQASVRIEKAEVGVIGPGLLVFLGVARGDRDEDARKLAEKVVQLRIFPDEKHAMNCSIADAGGDILVVSQFTLYADCRRGRRPSFDRAERPEEAEKLYREFSRALAGLGHRPQEGKFGARMAVSLENDGPVTILLESP